MKVTKEEVLKRLPKKYHDRLVNVEYESDLIDDCKYMVYYSKKYTDGECAGSCFPCKNMTNILHFIKNTLHSVE